MKCKYCNSEMEHKTINENLDFYGYIEGKPVLKRSFDFCSNCKAIYEGFRWSLPGNKSYLATEEQINTILKLIKKYKISNFSDDDLGLIYERNYASDKKHVIITKKDSDFVIKQLNLFGINWEEKLNSFINKNIKNEYFKSKFSNKRDLLKDLLKNKVDIFSC